MVRQLHIQPTRYFYAVGNTPAVCLTQSCPPDHDAALLLLGCGDARSVLFTAYADPGAGKRNLDITCCDIETEILARNIVLYTLILKDTHDRTARKIWNIYYHIFLDKDSLKLLRRHAAALVEEGDTLEEWHQGKYGKIIRFSDSGTFARVRQAWEFYAIRSSDKDAFDERLHQLKSVFEKARNIQRLISDGQAIINAARSVSPCLPSSIDHLSELYRWYWDNGNTLDEQPQSYKELNPMFGALDNRLIVHYGTDPLLGYHLSTAYTPIEEGSPLEPDESQAPELRDEYRVAFDQFRIYAESFRAFSSKLTLRFVQADALALCHTLQHLRAHGATDTAHWYRDNWHYEPFNLDSPDYGPRNRTESPAPTSFDVIDTSNLVDHLGCINVLVATSPLLKRNSTSTLLTELLVFHEENIDDGLQRLLGGNLATVSLLLSLMPIQYWTGTAGSAAVDELGKWITTPTPSQSRYILNWKAIFGGSSTTHQNCFLEFDGKPLADLVWKLYIIMFEDESEGPGPQDPKGNKKKSSKGLGRHSEFSTPATFASFLRVLKTLQFEEWEMFISRLCQLIERDATSKRAQNYKEDLYLQLHLQDVKCMPNYKVGLSQWQAEYHASPLSWKELPSAVCATVAIPHSNVTLFQVGSQADYGTPILQVVLASPPGWPKIFQHHFAGPQIGFGTLTAQGTRFTENYTIKVQNDPMGWDGTAPLIVSIMIPTWLVLIYPRLSAEISVRLRPNTAFAEKLEQKFGKSLNLFSSRLSYGDVYITKHRPNMEGNTSIAPPILQHYSQKGFQPTTLGFYYVLNEKNESIVGVSSRLRILPSKAQDIFRNRAVVDIKTPSAFETTVTYRPGFFHRTCFPMPVKTAGSSSTVKRKDAYVQFEASVATWDWLMKSPEAVYPLSLGDNMPVIRSLHYIALDKMPILDLRETTETVWMGIHMRDMFSEREHIIREPALKNRVRVKELRINFKNGLFQLFLQYSGVKVDPRPKSFVLVQLPARERRVYIFPTGIRLDLTAQTIVMDAAIVQVASHNVKELEPLLSGLKTRTLYGVEADEDEIIVWKHALVGFVEQARTWSHQSSCEYLKYGKIPISQLPGNPFICHCGQGRFPDDWEPEEAPKWTELKKYAVRAAISPSFPVPFVERSLSPGNLVPIPPPFLTETELKEISQEIREMHMKMGSCWSCGTRDLDDGTPLLTCSRCKMGQYCSKECQRTDWLYGMHRRFCSASSM
ncbi:hypothetical protein ASPZODRAFT_74025 [Penicilliopsis zonata CBS 506.65]|uniref:MYND-type domain-containing protein n=1 Tax=Penicilliopsis zonata CBS 506.65 TaxID=1073090 RepID=A0A1L9S903_9EURO|nr:hypothetical protein ASPZODRAFT_74025 [Penicilliopsis zonata CBS 506.65]OJJ43643.1 hypothetical protein ASPZODRAFT_74025 [Penicilliopsis zonata CBS 506.65]